ncbi:type II secretion system F family protein [Marinobacterium marinum]|nr:type II secretion system F family protein [Marinobacterium marinum]
MNRNDLLSFTSELAVLLKAGLPVDRALKVQAEMASKQACAELYTRLLEMVKSGKRLSHGFESEGDMFDDFYINMVRAGEASGDLAGIMRALGEHLQRGREVRSTIISALIYPAILLVVAVLAIAVMLGFVVPQFESLFSDMGDALPVMTSFVIALGDVVKAWWWLMVLLCVAVYHWVRRSVATPAGKLKLDKFMLGAPVLGAIQLKYEIGRFSRTLGTLLNNGVSLVDALKIAVATIGNSQIKQEFSSLESAVKSGTRVSKSLQESRFATPMIIQMVRVGEESGQLGEMLSEVADVYDQEVQTQVKRGLTLLEPVLILIMGGVIALIILSILMGILSVNSLAG